MLLYILIIATEIYVYIYIYMCVSYIIKWYGDNIIYILWFLDGGCGGSSGCKFVKCTASNLRTWELRHQQMSVGG